MSSAGTGKTVRRKITFISAVVAVVLGLAFGSQYFVGTVRDQIQPPPAEAVVDGDIAELRVVDKVDNGDYDRVNQFGSSWPNLDGVGCSEREDVLARDLTDLELDGCVVLAGVLDDPYTGEIIDFQRGVETSGKVQIDHIIPLKDAWLSGADSWTYEERLAFANDPNNLLASDGPTNGSKGARDASEWMPPDETYHCEYAERQVTLKVRYDLGVTEAERDALADALALCDA